MSSTILVRPATEADLPEITAIYAHHVRSGCATFELDPPSLDEMSHRYAATTAAGLPYLVADIEGHIAGYAYAGPYRPRPAYRFTLEDSIYVSPSWQRRGVGRTLLPELIGRCEQQDYRQMIAVIGDSANHASIRLHEMFDFRPAGVLENVGFKFGRWLDSVLMQRALSPEK